MLHLLRSHTLRALLSPALLQIMGRFSPALLLHFVLILSALTTNLDRSPQRKWKTSVPERATSPLGDMWDTGITSEHIGTDFALGKLTSNIPTLMRCHACN